MEIKDRVLTITRIKNNVFTIDINGVDVLDPVRTILEGHEIKIRLPIATHKAKIAYVNEE